MSKLPCIQLRRNGSEGLHLLFHTSHAHCSHEKVYCISSSVLGIMQQDSKLGKYTLLASWSVDLILSNQICWTTCLFIATFLWYFGISKGVPIENPVALLIEMNSFHFLYALFLSCVESLLQCLSFLKPKD